MYLTIIILPLISAIVSGLIGRKLGVTGSKILSSLLISITAGLSIIAFIEVALSNSSTSIYLTNWIDSERVLISWGFNFDSLTVLFAGSFGKGIEAVLVQIQLYKKMSIIFRCSRGSYETPSLIQKFFSGNLFFQLKSFKRFPFNNPLLKIKNTGRMNYLTINNIDLNNEKGKAPSTKLNYFIWDSNFIEWFVGFSDAEGCFIINRLLKKDNFTTFSFMFKIALHKDDEKVLRYIKDKLCIGGVRLYKDECIFNVSDKKGIALLISIFDKYNLNTSKHLDYLDFKEAFYLYLNRDKNLNPVNNKILELKNKMNTNRIHFDRSENSKIIITKNWLLGFIEGDGSFFLRRDTLTPTFSIELSGVQLPVLVKIKEFLESSALGFDTYSLYKLKNSSTIAINLNKARSSNGKSSVSLIIKNIYFLNNYLIPLFANRKFLTKKGEDFHDFQIICQNIYVGAHRKEEIRSLILNLSNTMNNFRLSTYKGAVKSLSLEEIEKLLSTTPTVEYLLDGRVIDSATKKVLPKLNSCVYEICEEPGVFTFANSLSEAASIVGLYPETLSKYLDIEVLNSEGVFVEVNKYKIRRVRVFFPASSFRIY